MIDVVVVAVVAVGGRVVAVVVVAGGRRRRHFRSVEVDVACAGRRGNSVKAQPKPGNSQQKHLTLFIPIIILLYIEIIAHDWVKP